MRHRRFLSRNHRYRQSSMNQFFDKEPEPQTDEPEKTSYEHKVFYMVSGINVEFGKKKKAKKDGTTARKKRKRDQMEEKL